MKRTLSLLVIAALASCSLFAQDDMYFTPKSKAQIEKEKAEKKAERERKEAEKKAEMERMIAESEKEEARRYAEYLAEKEKEEQEILELKKDWLRKNRNRLSQTEDGQLVYHVGRDVSADEYNRRGKFRSHVTVVTPDSVASDTIDFIAGNGEYPDSLIASIDSIYIDPNFKKNKRHTDYLDDDFDYYYTRRMNRFEYFFGSRRAWLLYNNPWRSHWAYDPFLWNDPWYWNSSWAYNPWFWDDPWYYDSFGYLGWSPFYYHSWGGWGSGHYHHYGGHYHNPIFVGGGHHHGGHHGGGNHGGYHGGGHSGSGGHHAISSNINNYDRVSSTRRSGLGSRNYGTGYSSSSRTSAIESRGNYNSSSSYSSPSRSSGTVSNSGSQYSTTRSSSYSNSSSSSSGSSYSSGSRSSGGSSGGSHSSGGGSGFRGKR